MTTTSTRTMSCASTRRTLSASGHHGPAFTEWSLATRVHVADRWYAHQRLDPSIPVLVILTPASGRNVSRPQPPRSATETRDAGGQIWQSALVLGRLGHDVSDDVTVVDSSDASDGRDSLRTVLGPTFRRDTLALWGAYLSCLLAVYLGFTWVPSMLTSAGLSALANTGIAVFNLGGVIGAIVGSLVITKLGSRVTMAVMTIGAIAGALVMRSMTLDASTSIVPVVAMLTVTGGLINAVQTTMYGLAAHIYPTSARATGVGAAAGIGRGGAILSTYAGAWALDTGGSRLFFALIAAAMLLTLASLMAIRRHIPGKVW